LKREHDRNQGQSMDAKFEPAMAAIQNGDLDALRSLLTSDPSLATARSSVSHPTLLQFLVLQRNAVANGSAMAKSLIEHGADIQQPLNAAACIDNVGMLELLLDAGASIEGDGRWSPLEEALYWGYERSVRRLLSRGATVKNLRIAAGLGRMDTIKSFFNADGSLKAEAGVVASPFRALVIGPRAREPQAIIDNAFVYACMHNHIDAATYLLERGAAINTIPAGFDYAGTGLHYAAFRGHRAMVEFLLKRGADPTVRDTKVHSTPASWAEHSGFAELKEFLEQQERRVGRGE
jgi:ankyrin repeat protein